MQRRHFLILGASAFFSAMLERAARADARPAKAKAMILLWMNGGPSHLDTWDPKPRHPNGGPTKAIRTSQRGLQISEHMPSLARVARKLTVVRSMTSREGNHQRAEYLMHTGYAPTPTLVHPSLGAWVAKKIGGPQNGLPPFVSIGGPSYGAGFLGVSNGPFVVLKAGAPPDDVTPATSSDRFARRQALLAQAEQRFAERSGSPMVAERRAVYARATSLMGSADLSAFDHSDEPQAVKTAYGETDFGRGCIVARRLVSAGVRFVEVVQDGWDTHQDNFNRVGKQLGIVDPAVAALVDDLDRRGMLASTLVVWLGDFGRSPKINAREGRDHHPKAWSAMLAGGGTRPGLVGATDAGGENVAGTAYGVPDLLATCASLMGLDPREQVTTPVGRPITITDGGNPIAPAMA
ncbi:MAG TPA: DUF1501 domain-containing protein [Polyangiaceae bacterium]|jgi:uncharacterized protein (DUF1501 family)